jgi:hypothetical protein
MSLIGILHQIPPTITQNGQVAQAGGISKYLIYVPLLALIVALLTFLLSQLWPRISARRDKRSLEKNMAGAFYTLNDIRRSREFYIQPYVQVIDPMGHEESRRLAPVTAKLFRTLDHILHPDSEDRYIFLLADSGMGKTSALMNYNIRQIRRRWKKHFDIRLVPLGIKDSIKHIESIERKHDTVLFLDAFDEDTQAIRDHHSRLKDLMNAAYGFRRVVISCRSQFFSSEEEIPKEPGVLKVATRSAGESAEYQFKKFYLTPFTERQTKKYLRRRYPLRKFRWISRMEAKRMVTKIPLLAARPMLLAHIDVIVRTGRHINYAFELYEEMVKMWLEREKGFISEKDQLRRFSELIAVNLYKNRKQRQTEHIPSKEIVQLARQWGIPIEDQQLSDYRFRTRSLLNRDADGNYKFAHRSIMEYLYVKRYSDGDISCLNVEWTDLMQTFYWEMLEKQIISQRCLPLENLGPDGNIPLGESEIQFLTQMAKHGLALLRSPKIAAQRFNGILETVTAICASLVDPESKDDPIISLIRVKKMPKGEYLIAPIASHYDGKLLNINEAPGLKRHKQNIEQSLYGDHVPDMSDEGYERVLGWLKRPSDGLNMFMIPVKLRGELLAVLIGETSRAYPFLNMRQSLLIDVLKVMGKYLQEYQ